MTIFFVISGYCIAGAARSALTRPYPLVYFLRARVKRIYPPYLLNLALWSLCLVLNSYLRGPSGPPSVADSPIGHGPLFYLATVTLTQRLFGEPLIQVIYWSLCYEVGFYVIVAAATALAGRGKAWHRLLYVLHAVTIVDLVGLIAFGRRPYPWDLWPQFGLGILAFHIVSAASKKIPALLLGVSVALIAALAVLRWGVGDFGHPAAGLSDLTSAGIATALVLLQPLDKALVRLRPIRWLSWVGTISYSLYLTHLTVLTPSLKLARKFGVSDRMVPLVVPVLLAMSVAFARVFFAFGERPFISRRAPRPDAPTVVPGVVREGEGDVPQVAANA